MGLRLFRISNCSGDAVCLIETSGSSGVRMVSGTEHSVFVFSSGCNLCRNCRNRPNAGFSMVDVRVQLSWSVKTEAVANVRPSEVRPVQDADIEGLKAIARGAHTDSRFFFDSRFGKEHAADLFAAWIATDCGGRADNVLVVDSSETRAVGYISCYSGAGASANRISLVGVADGFRGRGLGQALVAGALGWFRSVGAGRQSPS